MNKIKVFFITISLTFLLFSDSSYAQIIGGPPVPGDGGGDQSGPGFGDDDVNDEIVPINSLIALGLLGGAVYGIRKKFKS